MRRLTTRLGAGSGVALVIILTLSGVVGAAALTSQSSPPGGQVTEVADAGDDLDEVSVDEAAIDADEAEARDTDDDDDADEGSDANDDADEDADDD